MLHPLLPHVTVFNYRTNSDKPRSISAIQSKVLYVVNEQHDCSDTASASIFPEVERSSIHVEQERTASS